MNEGATKAERLLGMYLILTARGRIKGRDLAEAFGVSLRTIYRDVESLSFAGLPVRQLSGPGGGIELDQQYCGESKLFSGAELADMLSTLSVSTSLGADKDVQKIIRKIKCLVPQAERDQFQKQAESIFYDFSPWNKSTLRESRIRQIEDAIKESYALEVEYQDAVQKATSRVIEPHILVLKGLAWYLYAWCRTRNDFRVFRVSRIKSLHPTDTMFVRRDIDVSATPWNDIWRKSDGAIRAELRFDEFARSGISECFPEEEFISDGNGWYVANISAPTVEWLCEFVLSLGTHAVLLEPQEIRDRLADIARSILSSYE